MTKTLRERENRSDRVGLPVAAGLLALTLLAAPAPASAGTDPLQSGWNPVASEKLIKLPGNYLKKAIENDFSNSGLAAALQDTEIAMNLKAQTLTDLQGAIDKASGDVRVDLRHQFLAEKRAYLELVAQHQEFRRDQLETKMRLYDRLLGKLRREKGTMSPERRALVDKQEEARRRFETSVAKVDMKLFSTPMIGQSKYAAEYSKNVMAIERLVQAIQSHPMSDQNKIDGRAVTKQEFLRQMVAETQADLALVDQEETILGYMAKLIALDAMALTEAVATGDDSFLEPEEPSGLAAAINYFIPE